MTDSSTPGQRHGAGTYQMLWDCRFCGTKKLLGVTHRHCPNCGAAQDAEWRYFPAEEDMVALENHPYVGADKKCPACGELNSAASRFCEACGADLATGQVVQAQATRDLGTGSAQTDTRHDVVKDKFDAEMARVQAEAASQKTYFGLGKCTWIISGAVILAALVIIGIVYAVTYRKQAAGQVEALTWQRTIAIDDYQPRSDAAWRDQMPGDAYGRSCIQKQRSTRKVADGSHEECKDVDKGDGSFTRECHTVTDYRDEPVYDDWCTYTIDRWAHARSVTAQGEGQSPPPYWPQYTLSSGSGRYGAERVGGQDETYTVGFTANDKHLSCDFSDQTTWDQYAIGTSITVKLKLTGKPDCGTLQIAP